MKWRFPLITLLQIMAVFCGQFAVGQKAKLTIQINSDHLQTTDTLEIVGTYTLGDKALPPATFALVMKENNGDGLWQLRWPMINGHAECSLLFPPGIKKGNYTLYFAVEPRFFQAFGHILYPPGLKHIEAAIYSPAINPKYFDVPVDKDGSFKIDKFLFENSAILEIGVNEGKKIPAITMDAWLDSTFESAASISKEIAIGLNYDAPMENKKVDNWMAFFDPFYQTTILGDMPAAQKFDSVYVSPPFKRNLQAFDCLGDSELIKSKSLEAFLGKHFWDFQMDPAFNDGQTPSAHSKGYNFVFYLDEHLTTYEALNDIKLSDIAAIKILSPISSVTNPIKKEQCIIALYTKQGPFWSQDVYRYKYIVNGYQPPVYKLPPSPKMFATNPYYLF